MPRLYLFADEAGDFEFARKQNVSRYFILTTVMTPSCDVGGDLAELRRELAWQGMPLGDYFHASTDKQPVRDEVFATICRHDFSVQATVMEKAKAYPVVRESRARFYQYGWYYHFEHGTRRLAKGATELMVITASLGSKNERTAFQRAVDDVLHQTVRVPCISNFCPAAADPCLQVADYCAWALQRKWESKDQWDVRSYDLIRDRITYEYDLWEHGKKYHY